MRKCNVCGVKLVIGKNWTPSSEKYGKYICKSCENERTKRWKHKQPKEKLKKLRKKDDLKYRTKLGVGVYLIMHGDIKLYVGEGQLQSRYDKHFKTPITPKHKNRSKVAKYRIKNNLTESDFQLIMIYPCKNPTKRKERELHYRRELKPYLNPL